MAKMHLPGSGDHGDGDADRGGRPVGPEGTDEKDEKDGTDRRRHGEDTGAQAYGPSPAVERNAPDSPSQLPKPRWGKVLKGALKEFKDDELTDRAAALTYYAVLSLFPALLVLVSLLGIMGRSATDRVMDNITKLAPGPARDVLTQAVEQLQDGAGIGSIMAVVGLVLAVWSASGYVAGFIRASNAVYDIPEGRPVWKVLPVRVGITLVLMVMTAASAVIVVFTGGLARQVGTTLGIGDTALTVWSFVKWPVLIILVTLMIALLYWAAPNAKVKGFRWITPGSFLALFLWILASVGFAFYVANFASYNKTYGTMAGVVVFLIWLWITNLAILLGLEFDAETVRQRAIAGGHPPTEEPYTQPRDTTAWDEDDRRRMEEE